MTDQEQIKENRRKMAMGRRKALAGLATIGVASLGGIGTYAYVNDTETSKFSFQGGTIVLEITPANLDLTSESADDGSEMVTEITIKNQGTLPTGDLLLKGVALTGDEDLQNAASISTFNYRGTDYKPDLNSQVADNNNNGILDLRDLKHQVETNAPIDLEAMHGGDGLDSLGNESVVLKVGITVDYSQVSSNGGTLEASLNFAANQKTGSSGSGVTSNTPTPSS